MPTLREEHGAMTAMLTGMMSKVADQAAALPTVSGRQSPTRRRALLGTPESLPHR